MTYVLALALARLCHANFTFCPTAILQRSKELVALPRGLTANKGGSIANYSSSLANKTRSTGAGWPKALEGTLNSLSTESRHFGAKTKSNATPESCSIRTFLILVAVAPLMSDVFFT